MYKYKGKWPHTRLAGIQEPWSTCFSLINAASHVAGLMMLARFDSAKKLHMHVASAREQMAPTTGEALVAHLTRISCMSRLWIVTWVSSAVFHTRDTWLTEKLDYYSGNLAMCYMAFLSLTRAGWGLEGVVSRSLLAIGLGGSISVHMALGWQQMDYSRNMHVMIALLATHSVGWASRCLRTPAPHNKLFYVSTLLSYAAGALEIYDFPPRLGRLPLIVSRATLAVCTHCGPCHALPRLNACRVKTTACHTPI